MKQQLFNPRAAARWSELRPAPRCRSRIRIRMDGQVFFSAAAPSPDVLMDLLSQQSEEARGGGDGWLVVRLIVSAADFTKRPMAGRKAARKVGLKL